MPNPLPSFPGPTIAIFIGRLYVRSSFTAIFDHGKLACLDTPGAWLAVALGLAAAGRRRRDLARPG